MSEAAQKRTPLYDEHVRLGAKIVPFAGWLMPVQYASIVEEHQAVRNNVGTFDISHMGQLTAEGSGARDWLNTMLTNNIDKLDVGTGQYTFLLNGRGGIIDDLIVYRIEEQKFLLVVNAARTDEDFTWLQTHLPAVEAIAATTASDIQISNRSANFGGVAIQGPRVAELFHTLFGDNVGLPPRNQIVELPFNATGGSVARTGYRETALRFFARRCGEVWNVLETADSSVSPWLGARDIATRNVLSAHGSDLSPQRGQSKPVSVLSIYRSQIHGRDVLLRTKDSGPQQKLVSFRMKEKGPPPRPHYSVFDNGERIGEVTSGTLSPSLNYGIGMAYVSAPHAKIGTQIDIEIRERKFRAMIEKKPLYKKS